MRLRSVSSLDWRATERPLSLRHSDSKSALGCARGSIDCLLFSLSAADAFVASQGRGVNIRKLDPTGTTIEYEHSIAAGNFTEEFGDIVLGPDRSPRPMFHRGGSLPQRLSSLFLEPDTTKEATNDDPHMVCRFASSDSCS